jgi:hypothetical protein
VSGCALPVFIGLASATLAGLSMDRMIDHPGWVKQSQAGKEKKTKRTER